MLDEKIRNQLIANNRKIQEILRENEELIREEGYIPPVTNYALDDCDRIHFPSGYIRTSETFWKKYHLSEIVKNRNTSNNISYCLQLSDFYNYLINRFYIWGSVRNMLYKQDFVNLIAIMESLILETSCNISANCKNCSHISNCKNHIPKKARENMKIAIEKLCEIGIIDVSFERKNRIWELYDLRNRVHIRIAKNNEFLDDKFNLDLHNETITVLVDLVDTIYESGIQYYSKCKGYEPKISNKTRVDYMINNNKTT